MPQFIPGPSYCFSRSLKENNERKKKKKGRGGERRGENGGPFGPRY